MAVVNEDMLLIIPSHGYRLASLKSNGREAVRKVCNSKGGSAWKLQTQVQERANLVCRKPRDIGWRHAIPSSHLSSFRTRRPPAMLAPQ